MMDLTGQSPAVYFYFVDGLGSVTALSNMNGQLVERYAYDAFGNTVVTLDGGTGNPIRFTGRRLDPESGLYDYRARLYSPALGRFLQTDPLGYADAMNLYQYCGNNPIKFIDPWGLCKEENLQNLQLNPLTPGELWKDFLKNPNHWIPEGPPIEEKPTNKDLEKSFRQIYRNKYNNDRIGTHETVPKKGRGRHKDHPHYVDPDSIRPRPPVVPPSYIRFPGYPPLIIVPDFFITPLLPRPYNPHPGPDA